MISRSGIVMLCCFFYFYEFKNYHIESKNYTRKENEKKYGTVISIYFTKEENK